MKNKFYLTTAIPYVNAKPHLGFALELVQADCLARYYRSQGQDVFFLTGTDENALKNVQAAQKEGIPVQKLVEENAESFAELKKVLNLSNDAFIRTTEKRHFAGAQKLWLTCKKEDIYKRKYEGLYCLGCEEFKKEADLEKGLCPEHKKKPEMVAEENYFFRLSKYQNKLAQLVQSDQLKIVPQSRKNEVLSFIKQGLEDFSISRTKERTKGWGVPVPGDSSQVMYVWFDALSNYITALDYAGDGKLFKQYWPADLHMIGKGILRFHALYWPAILLSAGLALPKAIFVHGYLTINGQKISKSLGKVIEPVEAKRKFGIDALRYYLLKEISPTQDGDFTWQRLSEAYNNELANELGNLVNRVVMMVKRYKVKTLNSKLETLNKLKIQNSKIDKLIEEFKFNEALEEIWKEIREANVSIEKNKPWELDRRQALDARRKLEKFLQKLTHDLWLTTYDLLPFLPKTAQKIRSQLKTLKAEPLFPKIKE